MRNYCWYFHNIFFFFEIFFDREWKDGSPLSNGISNSRLNQSINGKGISTNEKIQADEEVAAPPFLPSTRINDPFALAFPSFLFLFWIFLVLFFCFAFLFVEFLFFPFLPHPFYLLSVVAGSSECCCNTDKASVIFSLSAAGDSMRWSSSLLSISKSIPVIFPASEGC